MSIAENRDSPFDAAGKVKSSIDNQTDVLSAHLEAVNINIGSTNAALARIEAALAASGNLAGIVGAGLKFVNNF